MILKQGHNYEPMPHDGKVIRRIYRGGRCYYHDGIYSLAATQALKAAFPQYWTAIRDYGYAHPQLVPFINEDPMLVCSLVEVGKTRWLVNDGVSYINTGFIPNTNSSVECEYQVITHGGGANAILGCRNVRGKDEFMIWIYNDYITRGWGATGQRTVATGVNVSLPHEIGMGNGWFLYDGTRSTQPSGAFTGAIPCYLFCCNTLGAPDSQRSKKAQISYAIFGGDTQLHLLPFTRNGENGMLDILSGTFHPNANTEGTFTIELTDKA